MLLRGSRLALLSSTSSAALTYELAISGAPVLTAAQGVEYVGFTVNAFGGKPPYAFSIVAGALPAGIELDPATGEVAGTPSVQGEFAGIVIQVEDSLHATAQLAAFALTVASPVDTTPDDFAFAAVNNAALATFYESDDVTITGINAPTTLSIEGGWYRKNGGALATTTTTVVAGDQVRVRLQSSATPGQEVAATLTIGGVPATFKVKTAAVEPLPAPTAMAFMGDSRTAFALGNNVSGTVWSSTQAHGQAVSGWFQHEGGNRILRAPGGMYAFPSSTTLRQVNALASASVATTGNAAQALTGASNNADAAFNPYSNGEYSVLDNPANVVVYLPSGTNDKDSAYYSGVAPNPIKSMQLIAGILDQLEAAGKIVLLGNEMPTGYNMAWAEAKTLTGATTSPTNITGFVDGESFGIVGVIDGDTHTPMTKVAGAPAVGEYSLTGATYTFNATRPAKVYLTYAYGPVTTGAYQFTLHEWLESSAATFVGSNGTNYGIPGALYGRPKVFSLDTWGAIADPATAGSATLAKKGSLSDPVHPGQFAGQLAGRAFAELVDELWPGQASQARRPTKNNWRAALAAGALGSVFQQLTLNPLPGVMGALPLTPGGRRVRLVSNAGTWIGVDDGGGNIVGTGFDPTPGRCAIDYATGVIKLFFAAPANTTSASNIIVEEDFENLLVNGLFDPAQGTVARPAGITGQDLPSGWSMLALNSELVTALGLGKAAGGIDIALAQVTAPDGTPGIQFTIDGNPGGGLPSLTINPAASLYQPQFRFNAANPDKFRSGVNARLEAGPNGHLYGVYGVSLSNTLTSSTTFTRAYNASNLNAVSGSVGGGTATVPYSDSIVADGPLDMELLIDELSTAGMTPSGLTWRASISLTPNAPNSCKATLWGASTRIRN